MSSRRIHSILLMKNEGDIIEEVLERALEWSDHIYVYDGASTDDGWEKVLRLAKKNAAIVPWKSERHVFREGLRAEVFDAFRSDARAGDWWCQLNADEIYIDNPKEFLPLAWSPVPLVVWGLMAQYYFTVEEAAQTEISSGSHSGTIDRLRYFEWVPTGEPRFFQHRRRLSWFLGEAWPRHLGLTFPRRILLKHYPYRNAQQIQMRLDVRRDHRDQGFEGWTYVKSTSWEETVVSNTAKLLKNDAAGGAGSPPECLLHAPVEHIFVRVAKAALHCMGIWP